MPFENLGLFHLEADFIATASDVLEAENMYPQARPLKSRMPLVISQLYMVIIAINKYYINRRDNIVNKDDVFIVGNSSADLLSAQKIGATYWNINRFKR